MYKVFPTSHGIYWVNWPPCVSELRFPSGPISLYTEFVEVSSCEIFRPKAHWLRRYSVAKSKPVFQRNRILRWKTRVARNPDPRSKNGLYLAESPTNCLSNAKIRSKIGQAVPELLLKNVTVFRVKVRKITSKIDSGGCVSVQSPSNFQKRWS